MSTVSSDIRKRAHELGKRARDQMEPRCEQHLRQLEYHPTHDEFKGTHVYHEFEELVAEHAEREGYDWTECDGMLREEFHTEVQEAFDETYYTPNDKIECVDCLEDGDIQIRVNDSDSVSAEEFLDGHVQSGNVKDDKHDWR